MEAWIGSKETEAANKKIENSNSNSKMKRYLTLQIINHIYIRYFFITFQVINHVLEILL